MKIRAITGFTAWDEGRMKVFNPGDSGDVTDALALDYIDAGKAKAVGRLPQLDHDANGEPGGSKPKAARAAKASAPSALGEARKAYKAVFGKAPGPRWTVAEIEAKIAEKAAEAAANGETDSEDTESVADAPPAA